MTISELGDALYGSPQWRAQFARDLGMSQPHFNRVVRGESPIMPDVAERICDLAKARREAVCRAVDQALAEGITA